RPSSPEAFALKTPRHTRNRFLNTHRDLPDPASTNTLQRRCLNVSKRGLPARVLMRHDSHYVDELAAPSRNIGRKIDIHLIEPNPDQPRTEFGDLTELTASSREKGVLERLLVKPFEGGGKWMIIAGERRWRASKLAGLT